MKFIRISDYAKLTGLTTEAVRKRALKKQIKSRKMLGMITVQYPAENEITNHEYKPKL